MTSITSEELIARSLRCDKRVIEKIGERLAEITEKKDVLSKLVEENNAHIKHRLALCGLSENVSAKEVYSALISKVTSDNERLFEALQKPDIRNGIDCSRVVEHIRNSVSLTKGFFLKPEKAVEFLTKEPPKKILEYLRYESVEEMLKHEDLYEVYSALRFIEGSEWLNAVFFKQYETLTPDDFEERDIQVRVISERWDEAAQHFIQKKRHNVSHLKELGVVFVIPAMLGISGELLRMVSLVLHYLHEVPFYADLFREVSHVPETFAQNIISLLRGDVIEQHPSESEQNTWLVVQRYLAKDDEYDWRLFYPHINPEALHWVKAEADLVKLGAQFNPPLDLSFWHDMDWVGGYFKNEAGEEMYISFDLVDTVMGLVKEKEGVKYLYHHQEALWNKLFESYVGREELERYARKNLLKGYFEV